MGNSDECSSLDIGIVVGQGKEANQKYGTKRRKKNGKNTTNLP